jgi:7-cyano-7-deazaguanine reductase
MKHLKKKSEFKYKGRDYSLLDTFPTPYGVTDVTLRANEVTSLCPITGQPDYHIVYVNYCPDKVCIESKSFKLYLGSFRMEGCFTETLSSIIAKDILTTTKAFRVMVTIKSASRGGVEINATAGGSHATAKIRRGND